MRPSRKLPDDTPSLSPALKELLRTAIRLRTTNNAVLAETLCCSDETIKSGFRRLSIRLDTHSRSETLLVAVLDGLVSLETPRAD